MGKWGEVIISFFYLYMFETFHNKIYFKKESPSLSMVCTPWGPQFHSPELDMIMIYSTFFQTFSIIYKHLYAYTEAIFKIVFYILNLDFFSS